MSRRERVAWIALLILAAGLRLVALGDRPPHHDEAVHAHFADILARQGAYRYDPTYHGPLLFYATAAVFKIAGESLVTLRLYPVLCGLALVALPLALRRRLGGRTAWWSAFVLAISPSFVYYSRFARNDVPVALFTAAAGVLALRYRDRGWRVIPWIGVAAALHAISKETFYVTLPLLCAGVVTVAAVKGIRRTFAAMWRWTVAHRIPVATATLWFVIITLAAYTFAFIHPEDAFFPGKAISYWYTQHEMQRVGGPWYYHLPRLGLYEFLILGAASSWLAFRRRPIRTWEAFCAGWGGAAILMYAYLGEKVPWLEVHQVLPFVPLAGAQLARTFSRAGRTWSRAIATAGIAGTVWSMAAVTFLYPTITPSDPHAELLVFVQTTPGMQRVVEEGRKIAARDPQAALAAVQGEAAWPLSWQWRDLKVQWKLPDPPIRLPLVLCDPGEVNAVRPMFDALYDERVVPLRAWWVETWSGVGPGQVLRWFVTRRAWSDRGSTDVTVFERRDVAAGGTP